MNLKLNLKKRKIYLFFGIIVALFLYDRYKPTELVYLNKMTDINYKKKKKYKVYLLKNPSFFHFNSVARVRNNLIANLERQIEVKRDWYFIIRIIKAKEAGLLDDHTPYEDLDCECEIWDTDDIGFIWSSEDEIASSFTFNGKRGEYGRFRWSKRKKGDRLNIFYHK
jgi:hypothetical protein